LHGKGLTSRADDIHEKGHAGDVKYEKFIEHCFHVIFPLQFYL